MDVARLNASVCDRKEPGD